MYPLFRSPPGPILHTVACQNMRGWQTVIPPFVPSVTTNQCSCTSKIIQLTSIIFSPIFLILEGKYYTTGFHGTFYEYHCIKFKHNFGLFAFLSSYKHGGRANFGGRSNIGSIKCMR